MKSLINRRSCLYLLSFSKVTIHFETTSSKPLSVPLFKYDCSIQQTYSYQGFKGSEPSYKLIFSSNCLKIYSFIKPIDLSFIFIFLTFFQDRANPFLRPMQIPIDLLVVHHVKVEYFPLPSQDPLYLNNLPCKLIKLF